MTIPIVSGIHTVSPKWTMVQNIYLYSDFVITLDCNPTLGTSAHKQPAILISDQCISFLVIISSVSLYYIYLVYTLLYALLYTPSRNHSPTATVIQSFYKATGCFIITVQPWRISNQIQLFCYLSLHPPPLSLSPSLCIHMYT